MLLILLVHLDPSRLETAMGDGLQMVMPMVCLIPALINIQLTVNGMSNPEISDS